MKYAEDYSGYGNKVLYKMCSEKPKHDDIEVISSKLWIIGRSYSAAIERKAGSDFKIEEAAAIIKDSNIDKLLTEVQKIERPTRDNIDTILKTHKIFTDLLKKCTNLEKRSLASKYLHFHAPKAFFIYDSIAKKALNKILKDKKISMPNIIDNYDNEYSSFAIKCIYFRDNIFEKEINALATPRKIDMKLLDYGKL